jgi:hypothetical protein
MDVVKSILPALAISAIVSGGTAVMNQQVHGRLLEDNIKATQDLSRVMQDLRFQLGIFSERYVTREELDRRLEKLGGSNGA